MELISEYIQNEIDNIENQIADLESMRNIYTVQCRLNPMEYFSEENFRKRFRLTKRSVIYLHTLIGADLEPKTTRPGFTLSALDKILITLRYYAIASYHQVSADFYGVAESTVCRIIPIVSDKIASLRERFIYMPTTNNELEQKKQEFFRVAGMPAVIGAIDGTLVKIQEVGGAQNKTDFYCRKQFYAINVQIICDANAFVQDIVARWPGSIHDETVFLNSNIFERFLNGEFTRNNRKSLLLGDGGYRSESFLAVPLRETNRQRTQAEINYQRPHISTRNVVERFNGQWKKRFPCLWIGTRFRKLETVLDVIVATAVLHNICKMHGDHMPPPLSRHEEVQYNRALDIERNVIINMSTTKACSRTQTTSYDCKRNAPKLFRTTSSIIISESKVKILIIIKMKECMFVFHKFGFFMLVLS